MFVPIPWTCTCLKCAANMENVNTAGSKEWPLENIFCCSLECLFQVATDSHCCECHEDSKSASPTLSLLIPLVPKYAQLHFVGPTLLMEWGTSDLCGKNTDAIEIKKSSDMDFSGDRISHFAWCSQLHMAALGNLSCQCWAQGFWIESCWKLYLWFLNMGVAYITCNDIKKCLT